MKRILALVLGLILALSLVACKKQDDGQSTWDPDRNAGNADPDIVSAGAYPSHDETETVEDDRYAEIFAQPIIERYNNNTHVIVRDWLAGSLTFPEEGMMVYGLCWYDKEEPHIQLSRYVAGDTARTVEVRYTQELWDAIWERLDNELPLRLSQDGPFTLFNATGMAELFPDNANIFQ